jgi:hypothetical protein
MIGFDSWARLHGSSNPTDAPAPSSAVTDCTTSRIVAGQRGLRAAREVCNDERLAHALAAVTRDRVRDFVTEHRGEPGVVA